MNRDMAVVEVEATHTAVIRGRVGMHEIPAGIMPLVQQVWSFFREGGAGNPGHNVWIYHHRADGKVDVEVGVQMASPFSEQGDIVPGQTPTGRAAHAVHYGDYAGLPQTHQALREWCSSQGLAETGDNWEVYGDWHEDPTQRRADVYHLLTSE